MLIRIVFVVCGKQVWKWGTKWVDDVVTKPKPKVPLDRAKAQKEKEEYWKEEAKSYPERYDSPDIEKMKEGKPPTGPDGHGAELHHRDGTLEGGTDPMSRTDHGGKGNFKQNHPWL